MNVLITRFTVRANQVLYIVWAEAGKSAGAKGHFYHTRDEL